MPDIRHGTDPLTDREQEILACLAEGLSNREIAGQLHLAYDSVRWYNSQIYSKLGVNNRKDAIERATVLDLLEVESDTPQAEGKHNLPLPTTPFVGRHHEINELTARLNDGNMRLATILAPGGMGKTRLSLEVARSQIGRYTDGVFFVPLAPLSSPNDIVTTIAENIGFVFHGENPPAQQLVDFLKDRSMLLVLDNFEHLLEGALLVTDIVKSAQNVKLLVTSRERLNLHGENVYALRGLEFPTWETPEDALEYDAVKLFVQSANRVRSDFELHPDDLDFLARICRLTAGMPLGIELAAGWVDVLSLEQIAEEIQQGIDILETDMRDVPERHRSLRATFTHTWDRLTDNEKTVFARLSVFRGGFTLQAGEAVTEANARHLRKLARKSLIQTESNERYAIHELLRQYAGEQLQASDGLEAIKTKHAEFFAELFTPVGNATWGENPSRVALTKKLNPDFENVRVAWQFYTETKNLVGLQRLLNGIWMFLDQYSRSHEAVVLLEEALMRVAEEESEDAILLRAQVLVRQAWFYCDLGQRYKALSIYEQVLPAIEQFDSLDGVLLAYVGKGITLWFMGKLEEVLECLYRGSELVALSSTSRWRPFLENNKAPTYYEMGRYDDALQWEQSRPIDQQNPITLGMILYQLGRYDDAESYLLQAEQIVLSAIQTQTPHFYSVLANYRVLITINMFLGKDQQVGQLLQQALERTDNTRYAWVTLEILEVALDFFIVGKNYQTAIEILSLINHQSDETGFIRNRALKHQNMLQESVPQDVYADAWERGKMRELNALVTELLSKLRED